MRKRQRELLGFQKFRFTIHVGMIQANENFEANIERSEAIRQVHAALSGQVTAVIDLSDLLRFEIVQAVSALDCLIHDIVLIGMLEIIQGTRTETNNFLKYSLTMETAIQYKKNSDTLLVEREIRNRHSYQSFQRPDKISEAFRLFSSIDLWGELELKMGIPKKELKQRLVLIVDRRNKIVHEGDLSPVFPRRPWNITSDDAMHAREFITQLGRNILTIVI